MARRGTPARGREGQSGPLAGVSRVGGQGVLWGRRGGGREWRAGAVVGGVVVVVE